MRPVHIVAVYPGVQVDLQLLQRMIQLAPEGNPIKFVQDRFVETLADAVCLRMPRPGFGVLYAVYTEVQFIIVLFELPAIFRASVRQDADEAHFL